MSDYISKAATVLDIKTAKDTRDWLSKDFLVDKDKGIKDVSSYSWEPVLIKTNFDSFFDVLEKEAEKQSSKICQGTNKKEVIKNIKSTKKKIENSNAFNFLKNSSIWMRLCDNDNWNGVVSSDSEPESVKKAWEEFVWFKELGLYEFNSAKEFLEYNVRAQKENYIAEIGGHDTHVTPLIYSDETKYRDFFLGYDDNKELPFKFLDNENQADFKTNNVAMRILLVDDKIGRNNEKSDCNICQVDEKCPIKPDSEKGEPCKLKVISKLLSGKFLQDKEKQKIFNKRTYWSALKLNEAGEVDINVKSYVIDKVKISDVWELSEDGSHLDITENWKNSLEEKSPKFINNETNCVQIIGVRDLESALALMSCCKFDFLLLDYLLSERTGGQDGRVYSTELFEFLQFKFRDKKNEFKELDKCPDIVQMFAKGIVGQSNKTIIDAEKMKFLELFRDEVKLNRGPLDKYWIVPMTSYNSSFISDLQRRNVPLIDYRWNISQGADPINTPWKFLYKLNEFIELQLRSCVYTMEQLLTFLLYTCQDLNTIEETVKVRDKEEKIVYFEDFQSFMGSEYATLVRLYGNKFPIERDAVTKEEEENSGKAQYKSVFATYVWENFYANQERKYVNEIELYRLMHRFYHRASVMYEDQRGKKLLNDAFSSLWFFLHSNYKVREEIKKNATLEELYKKGEGLSKLKEVVEKCTADKKRD